MDTKQQFLARRAFTLFEVLIALAIVVVLVGVMSSTISVAFKQKRSAEEAIDAVRDIQIVGDIWVQELECAVPPNLNSNVDPTAAQFNNANAAAASGTLSSGSGNTPTYLFGPFLGSSQSISFYASGPEPKAPIQSDSRYVSFDLEVQPDNTMALVRHVEPNLLTDADPSTFPSGLDPEIMISNVQSVQFQYFDGNQWTTDWDSTQPNNSLQLSNILPYAVSIELTLNPQHDGAQPRVIKRFATIWCADAAYSAASATAATAAAAAGG